MSGRPSEAAPTRVNVDTEAAWFKIKADLEANMTRVMEMRLATLPGGKDGDAAKALRKEVEARLSRVGLGAVFHASRDRQRHPHYIHDPTWGCILPIRKIWAGACCCGAALNQLTCRYGKTHSS